METQKHCAIYNGLTEDEKNIVDAIAAFLDNISKEKKKTLLAAASWELYIKDFQGHQ